MLIEKKTYDEKEINVSISNSKNSITCSLIRKKNTIETLLSFYGVRLLNETHNA